MTPRQGWLLLAVCVAATIVLTLYEQGVWGIVR